MQSEIITILIPPRMWLDVSGNASRLKTVISINGTLMHLEAIQVEYIGVDREQHAVNDDHASDFDLLCRYGSEGQFETTDINGHPYVLVATPFT